MHDQPTVVLVQQRCLHQRAAHNPHGPDPDPPDGAHLVEQAPVVGVVVIAKVEDSMSPGGQVLPEPVFGYPHKKKIN
jgi:hypothetical protein